jgi:hypothetical protein
MISMRFATAPADSFRAFREAIPNMHLCPARLALVRLAKGEPSKIGMGGSFIKRRETMNFVNFAGRKLHSRA